MAVIKYSGLVDQLRGKLAGTVFSKYHGGYNSYKKGQPKRWGSQGQQKQRIAFATASTIWRTTTQTNRTRITTRASLYPQKNRFGEDVFLSPYHYAIMLFRLRQASGMDPAGVISTTIKPLTSFSLATSSINVELKDNGIYYASGTLGLKRDNVGDDITSINFYISSAVASTNLTPRRTHYYVAHFSYPPGATGSNVSVTIPPTPLPSSFTPSTGNQLELKMIFWRSNTGIVLGTRPVFRLPFTYTPPVDHLPYIITMSAFDNGRIWEYYQASYPNPGWFNILARGILDQPIPGVNSDYVVITDVALTGQNSNVPDETLLLSAYKTIETTPNLNDGGNPLRIFLWPNDQMLPQLNASPLVTLSSEPTFLTVRFRLRRLSDGLETVPFLYTINPNYPV